jgi:hypothetical protein
MIKEELQIKKKKITQVSYRQVELGGEGAAKRVV